MGRDVAAHEGHVAVDGRQVGYCLYNAEASNRVVFEYGTPGTRWLSARLVAAAVRADCELLVVDRPGYGTATRRPGRRVVDVAEDLAAVLDDLGWDQFRLWGGSGGGAHALAIAARFPRRVLAVASVVGLAPYDAPGLDWFAGMSEGNVTEFTAAARGETEYRPIVERLVREAMARIEAGGPPVPDEYDMPDSDRVAFAARQSDDDHLEQMKAMFTDGVDGWIDDSLALTRPWGFDLESLSVPTSIWWGANDGLVSGSHSEHLLVGIPNAHAQELCGGHILADDDLDAINGWLLETT